MSSIPRYRVAIRLSTDIVYPTGLHSIPHRKKQSSGPTGRAVSFAQLALVLHVFLSCEVTTQQAFRSLTATSLPQVIIVDHLTEFSGIKCTFQFASLCVTKESPWRRT
jgi:hypothetical protein